MRYINAALGDTDFNGALFNEINALVLDMNNKTDSTEFFEVVQETGKFVLFVTYSDDQTTCIYFETNDHSALYTFVRRSLGYAI